MQVTRAPKKAAEKPMVQQELLKEEKALDIADRRILADALVRLIAFVVSHVQHEGEGDDMYNELVPSLDRVGRGDAQL